MRPVPIWLANTLIPEPGEVPLDFWGPMVTYFNEYELSGFLYLTNRRFAFVRAEGEGPSFVAVQFVLPLPTVVSVTTQWTAEEVYLNVNNVVFHGIVPPGVHPGMMAQELQQTIIQTRQKRVYELQAAAAPATPSDPPTTGPPGNG
ncbi:MAG: hypothetical protein L3K23_09470 [Thermoplasmata archaeon]|nr:hypothetical protein [Thermoplasmata archaeon]